MTDDEGRRRVKEGSDCRHGVRVVRPASRWGSKGTYCLECGWRCWKQNGVIAWGGDRLPAQEVEQLRQELRVT